MHSELETLTLDNICRGALVEHFDHELRKVLQNIKDPNAPADVVRSMKIVIKFKPDKDRASAAVSVSCASTMAGLEPAGGRIYINGDSKSAEAYPDTPPEQRNLFVAPSVSTEPQ